MNFNLRLFLCCLSFLFTSINGFAQKNFLLGQNLSTVNIDQVPDEEISAYYFKAIENGISEEEMYKILQQKGLPDEQISKLEERISKINKEGVSSVSSTSEKDKLVKTESKRRYANMDAEQVPFQKIDNDLTIFGSELFTKNSMVFEPNLRIPSPTGYILGPDDELVINVFGYSEKTYNVTVSEEGYIYIPQMGPLFVSGLSIEDASARIKQKLGTTIYKAIGSGQTKVQVSLGKIRSIRVTVIGEAKKPGSLTVSSLTTLFNLLYFCGGPTDLGSYRKIELIRGNEVKRIIDLYSFLLKGDQKDNLLLHEGDVVRIPYYVTRVILNGNVKRKGKYELVEGETFENLLQISGGFADDAYKSAITAYQLTETERKIVDVSKQQFNTYHPLSSDSIVVGQLLNRFQNKLTVKGAVMRPGEFELTEGLTLKQLLEKAGGLKEDVYSKRGTIRRLNWDNTPIRLSFDIDSIIREQLAIPLKKNDEITIYSIFDLKAGSEISIDGYVNNPGRYKWAQNITLQDVILLSGGLTESADNKNIEIARRIDNVGLKELNHLQTEIITVDLSDSANTKDILLKPYDVINIRQKSGFSNQRTVIVEGMVINPGRYTLKRSGDRISDVLKRAGGFRANADTTALVIKRVSNKNQSLSEREKVFSKLLNINPDSISATDRIRNEVYKDYDKVSIDLNKALHEKAESDDMLLEDGDILTIEQNSNLVKVNGEVYYPTIIPFKEGKNFKYYIQKSGSYTDQARKNGALVIYPDGKANKVKHFLFFKSYPKVVSRSEIFVPQKSNKNKSRISLAEWSVILSSLALISNVIINLKK